jgi:hypothetical protein
MWLRSSLATFDKPMEPCLISNSQLPWSKGSRHGLASMSEMNGSEGIAGHLTGWMNDEDMRVNPR